MISSTPNYKLEDLTIDDIYETLRKVIKYNNKDLETSSIFELNIMFNNLDLRKHFQTLKEQNLKKLKQYAVDEVDYVPQAMFYKKVNNWFNLARKMGNTHLRCKDKDEKFNVVMNCK